MSLFATTTSQFGNGNGAESDESKEDNGEASSEIEDGEIIDSDDEDITLPESDEEKSPPRYTYRERYKERCEEREKRKRDKREKKLTEPDPFGRDPALRGKKRLAQKPPVLFPEEPLRESADSEDKIDYSEIERVMQEKKRELREAERRREADKQAADAAELARLAAEQPESVEQAQPDEEVKSFEPEKTTEPSEEEIKKQAEEAEKEAAVLKASYDAQLAEERRIEVEKRHAEIQKYWALVETNRQDFTSWSFLLALIEKGDDVSYSKETFETFFSCYPFCYGYWKKYADFILEHDGWGQAFQIYEKAVQAVPLSVDMWSSFIEFVLDKTNEKNKLTNTEVRRVLEQAVDTCGLDFRSDKIWDKFIEWETEVEEHRNIFYMYKRLLQIPTYCYQHHYENVKSLIDTHSPQTLLTSDDLNDVKIRADKLRQTESQPANQNSSTTTEKTVTDETLSQKSEPVNQSADYDPADPDPIPKNTTLSESMNEVVDNLETRNEQSEPLSNQQTSNDVVVQTPGIDDKQTNEVIGQMSGIGDEQTNDVTGQMTGVGDEQTNGMTVQTPGIGDKPTNEQPNNADEQPMEQKSVEVELSVPVETNEEKRERAESIDLTEDLMRAIKITLYNDMYTLIQRNEQEVGKRWPFEDAIKRPYFHTKPLDRAQLKNWRDYLSFEIVNKNHDRVIALFERCVIACAQYEEFWLKYCTYLEKEKYEDGVRVVFTRACTQHLPYKTSLHLTWAFFEERAGQLNTALNIINSIEQASPSNVSVINHKLNLLRRKGDDVKSQFKTYLNSEVLTSDVKCKLTCKYARYLHKIQCDGEEAELVLKSAITKYPGEEMLYSALLDVVYQITPISLNKLSVVFKIIRCSTSLAEQVKMKYHQRHYEILDDLAANEANLIHAVYNREELPPSHTDPEPTEQSDGIVDKLSEKPNTHKEVEVSESAAEQTELNTEDENPDKTANKRAADSESDGPAVKKAKIDLSAPPPQVAPTAATYGTQYPSGQYAPPAYPGYTSDGQIYNPTNYYNQDWSTYYQYNQQYPYNQTNPGYWTGTAASQQYYSQYPPSNQ